MYTASIILENDAKLYKCKAPVFSEDWYHRQETILFMTYCYTPISMQSIFINYKVIISCNIFYKITLRIHFILPNNNW